MYQAHQHHKANCKKKLHDSIQHSIVSVKLSLTVFRKDETITRQLNQQYFTSDSVIYSDIARMSLRIISVAGLTG